MNMSAMRRIAAASWVVITSSAGAQAATAPVNDRPNPYQTIEGWAKMPAGRTWGSTSAADVDEELGTLHWQPQWDKMGHDWRQPMRDATREALRVAREWREKNEYDGPWIIPAGSSKNANSVYTIQSLWAALRSAQVRAGVELKPGRGGHGFRRTFAGDVNAETGDPALALLAIGDTDLRQANTYVQKRDERVKNAFDRLDSNAKTKAEAAAKDEGVTE